VDVADVEAVEGNAVGERGDTLRVTGLAILLCFSELRDYRDAE